MQGSIARSFTDRLLGRHRRGSGEALVLRTRSVHTYFESEPLTVLGLDRSMRVSHIRSVRPNRVAMFPSARLLIELPPGAPVPALHSRVEVADG